MTVRFLLDEHFSPLVQRVHLDAGLDAQRVGGGPLAGQDDEAILAAAEAQGRILVTCDAKDFVPLLTECAKTGRRIPGIVLVDPRTWPTDEPERLAAALVGLAAKLVAGACTAEYGLFLER